MTTRPQESILVRVSPEILEQMKAGDIEPVVILGVEEQPDGTYDMTLKVPDAVAENRRHRGAAPSGFAHGGTVSDETAQNLDVHVVPVIAPPWYLDAARKEAEEQSSDDQEKLGRLRAYIRECIDAGAWPTAEEVMHIVSSPAREIGPVSDEVRERITERIEGALRSTTLPWPEDPDGFYYSSADVLTRWIIEQIDGAQQ